VSRILAWLLTAPILVVGVFAGHEAGFRVAVPHAIERAHELEETGHSYFEYAPFFAASLAAIVALALALRVRAALTARPTQVNFWAFAALPPLAFVLLETFERLSHGGLTLEMLTTPQFVLGLASQLPFALAAVLVAKALLRFADAVAMALRQSPPVPRRRFSRVLEPSGALVPRLRFASLAWGERGPPFS
jgi:hypothetical protein